MVLDSMAASDDIAAQCRVFAGAPADAEERSFGIGGVEQVKDARGDVGVRSVVDGDGNFAAGNGGIRQTGQVGAKQRGARQQAGGGDDGVVDDQRTQRPWPNCWCKHAADERCSMQGERGFDGEGWLPGRCHVRS